MVDTASRSYRASVKALVLIGGSSVVVAALGAVRSKVVAVTLGPTGIGALAVLNAVVAIATVAAGLGVNQSGVRQIAVADSRNNDQETAADYRALSRVSVVLGLVGAAALAAASPSVSEFSFGRRDYGHWIALASIAVFARIVIDAQTALLQGLRRIWELSLVAVLGALLGSAVAIPAVIVLGQRGIPLFVVLVSAGALLTSWGFASRVALPRVAQRWAETWARSRQLFGLGAAFMFSALASTSTAYLLQTLLVRSLGLSHAGHYQAAFSISSVYVGFVLAAMGKDFYPRLAAEIHDPAKAQSLVNEQTELGLLLATPGLLATLVFAPWVIAALYSGDFAASVPVLRWQVLGIFGRVVSWPLGFIMLAKGAGRWFLATEVLANAVHLGLVWAGVRVLGLEGAGMAFFLLYFVYLSMMLPVANRLIGFRWSRRSFLTFGGGFVTLGAGFLLTQPVFGYSGVLLGAVLTLVSFAISGRSLARLLGFRSLRVAASAAVKRVRRRLVF